MRDDEESPSGPPGTPPEPRLEPPFEPRFEPPTGYPPPEALGGLGGGLGEPIPFRMLLDEAAKVARRNFRSLYLPVALPVALVQVLTALISLRFVDTMMGGLSSAEAGDIGWLIDAYALFVPLMVVTYLVFVLGYTALHAGAVDAAAGRPVHMGARWRFVFRPGVLFTFVLSMIAVLVGLVLCVLPGLLLLFFLTVFCGLLVPVMAEEGRTLWDALTRAFHLGGYNPQGRFATSPRTKTFVVLVVGMVLSWAASLAVQMPFSIVQQIMVFRELSVEGATDPTAVFNSPWQWLSVPSAFFGSLAQTVVALYVGTALALLYFDVRRRREGGDLMAALEELPGTGEGREIPR